MLRTLMSLALGMTAGIGATAAFGQGAGGPGDSGQLCMVTQLRLRFATGNDDLRGGQDNLNIVVYFTGGGYQVAPNVNHSKNWPNNSVNMVEIPLNRPVPPGEIRALRLVHIADGGFNIHSLPELATPAAPIAIAQAFQSPDNWNMADVEVAVIGNGVGGRIANHGFHRFTGSNPDLIIDTHVPPNVCGSERPAGNSGGTRSGSSGGGSGTLMSPSAGKGMLADQSRSPALREGNQPTNAMTPGAGANSGQSNESARPLTNSDVLNMLRAGLPEEIILTTIRNRPATFDVSNQARAAFDRECASIKHSGMSNTGWGAEVKQIWDTMTNATIAKETNGRGGEDVGPPNPPPTPPGERLNGGAGGTPPAKQLVVPPNLKLFTVGEVRNPAASTLLRSGAQLQGSAGDKIGPGQTMSATGNSPSKTAPSAAASSRMQGGPAAVQRGGGSNQHNAISPNTTKVCLNKTGIDAVNGGRFTQFTPGTRYVITGCGYGSTPGKVYLTGAFPAHSGRVELGPYYQFGVARTWTGHWSESEIDAQLDEGLAGELDQYNVSLVVETSAGQRIQMGNSSFQAQRAEFMLARIPSNGFGFSPDPGGAAQSPCTPSWVTGDCTVDVLRNYFHTDPTPDRYTINLRSGFVLSRAVLLVMSQTKVTNFSTPQINGNQIVVNWNWTKESSGFTYSLYGLQIYVVGPLGVTDVWANGQ